MQQGEERPIIYYLRVPTTTYKELLGNQDKRKEEQEIRHLGILEKDRGSEG